MSSSLLQRLSLMAGVPLTEAQKQPDSKSTQVKTLSEAAKEIGWYVTNADDKEVAGPLSLPEARSKAKELGGDAKGFDVSYTSDYDSKRASVSEATGSNEVFDDISTWKAACKKAGCEVYSQGAADGKYTAKKNDEVCGRFNKESGEGWLHSSAMSEAAIGEPWVVHLKFRKKGEERTFNSVNYKLNAPDKERAKSYAIADYEKKGYVDVSAVRATPAKAVKEDTNYDDEGNVIPEGPLPQGLAEIARQLGFQTLDTRNSDSLDFKEVSVGGVKSALLAAYNLGKTQATTQATPAEQQPQSGGLPVPQGRTPADHQQAGPVGIAR